MKNYKVNYINLPTGEKIAYREAGDGNQIIVLVHGNMSSSVHFQPLMERLEKEGRFKIYAPDMPGFGDSTYNKQRNSLHEFSWDITAFIEALDLTDVTILGWSSGGGVVLETAADISERIKKIFLQSSVGIQGYPMFRKDENLQPILTERIYKKEDIACDPVQVLPVLEAHRTNNREFFKYIWNLTIYNKVQPSHEDYEIYLDAILKQRNLVDLDYSLAVFNMTHDSNGVVDGSGRIDLVKAPVVLLHGADDMVVPKQFAQTTKDYFGDRAELVFFEGMGHSLFTDDMDRFFREFVSRI